MFLVFHSFPLNLTLSSANRYPLLSLHFSCKIPPPPLPKSSSKPVLFHSTFGRMSYCPIHPHTSFLHCTLCLPFFSAIPTHSISTSANLCPVSSPFPVHSVFSSAKKTASALFFHTGPFKVFLGIPVSVLSSPRVRLYNCARFPFLYSIPYKI